MCNDDGGMQWWQQQGQYEQSLKEEQENEDHIGSFREGKESLRPRAEGQDERMTYDRDG